METSQKHKKTRSELVSSPVKNIERKAISPLKPKSPRKALSPQKTSSRKVGSAKPKPRASYPLSITLGSGAFGTVYQSTDPQTGLKVAVKKVIQDPRFKCREVEILKTLRHPNIIGLLKHFFTPGPLPNESYLHIVMNYYPLNLLDVIQNYYNYHQKMPMILIKLYSYQLLRSLVYCELSNICHRDIKPQNILVDPSTGQLVLCDFGCAKKLVRGESNLAYICSRYYRAPELILGSTNYGCLSDVWSAGCVIAEMITGQPLFSGKTSSDQLVEIIKVLGTLQKEEIQEINPLFVNIKLPEFRKVPWARVIGESTEDVYEFFEKVIVALPSKRLSAAQALQLPFFDEVRAEGGRMPNGRNLPDLFNWTQKEINSGVHLSLTPDWALRGNGSN